MAARPGTVICYICGREYGSRSISIHEPQCLKKWKAENDKLPRDQRRPVPVKPDILPSLTGGTGNDGKRFNELAWQAAQVMCILAAGLGKPNALMYERRFGFKKKQKNNNTKNRS